MLTPKELHERRKVRTRSDLKKKAGGRPRLSVHRSGENIYAQIIDDATGTTLASASTLCAELRKKLKTGADKAAAAEVGKLIAKKALEKGVKLVAFDRGGYVYHGRVAELANAAREAGLEF